MKYFKSSLAVNIVKDYYSFWTNVHDFSCRVMKVAKKFLDDGKKVHFAVSNKDDMSFELSEYGLDTSGDKPVVAARDASDQKFVMKDEFR